MFTGIIEETGKIESATPVNKGMTFQIKCERILSDLKTEDSVAVNGVCLTASEVDSGSFKTTAVEETLTKSTLDQLSRGDAVNLERAVRMEDRLGGHLVSGHVDGTAVVRKVENRGVSHWLEIEIPDHLEKYVILKGSIAINGISLTVAEIRDKVIAVAVIPYTYENTNLRNLKIQDSVNIETDILGKYIEKFVTQTSASRGFSEEQLREMGY